MANRPLLRRPALLAATLLVAGCDQSVSAPASRTWLVPITSTPPGVQVKLDNGMDCHTPCMVKVPVDETIGGTVCGTYVLRLVPALLPGQKVEDVNEVHIDC
jgi:hypothetical protein